MFEFLKIQYKLGNVTKEQLFSLIDTKITKEEYDKIVNS